jgi:signal transduction histidine kinase
MLAESLGDRTLAVAYWLPDRDVFVDESGRQVDLPEPGSGRAWTSVDRGGRRLAAIVHDAELDATPELVQAAAAGAALALDNERLKADLRARLEELRASRVRIVEAGYAARRRIERDLHDGAQQQLVALSIDLRLIKSRLGEADPDTKALAEGASEKLASALAELRELARGIHPAVLSERGLGPAVEAIAQRAPVPVECHLQIRDRLPDPLEAAAYFVAAEALTNVAKYAQATSAEVRVIQLDDELEVEVVDDGIGGASADRGSGLRGLADRVAAVDGTLSIVSPEGQGTRVVARIPYNPSEVLKPRGEERAPRTAAPSQGQAA